MDDLIVIIITILFAVIGILSQQKKKREAANASTPKVDGGQPADFWEMIMGEREPEQPYQAPVFFDEEPAKVEIVEEKKNEFQPSYSFKASNEGSSDIEGKNIQVENPAKKKVLIEGEDFSLRKAVIYSEIMNRKYT